MPPSTRREFLATTSLTLAGAAIGTASGATPARAQHLPRTIGHSPLAATAFLPTPMAAADMHALAAAAVDAARSAGASFADIRVAERHRLQIAMSIYDPINASTVLESVFSYGIRVLVDGSWAFVHGTTPSLDAVTKCTRDAVATARGYAALATMGVELSPRPVVTGEWTTPIQLDPFTVPLRDQTALLKAYRMAAERVRHGGAGTEFRWTRETRVFASTDGSRITQTLYRSDPDLKAQASWAVGFGGVQLELPRCATQCGGYETVAIPGLQDEMKRVTEEAVELAALPRGSFDVGRYPVIFDGTTVGMMLAQTVGAALELDRVLGYEADAAGTSYLAPPETMLGTSIVSPLLSVQAHRAPPAVLAAKWDDEGVETQEFPLITQGRLVNYCTSRQTAPAVQAFYEKGSMPRQSRGCAVAGEADDPVMVRLPHLAVTPGTQSATLKDLYKDVSRGMLICGARYLMTNQQLTSGTLMWTGEMFEIARGKLVRRVERAGIQFGTKKFWQSLTALGDASTVRPGAFNLFKGQPWRTAMVSTSAPAGVFKDVNVVSSAINL